MKRTITSEHVRTTFVDFFLSHGHTRIPGASLIPQNDPTLLFINSGMASLKPYFTGQQKPSHPDLCNVQPCLRTKDIDDVGDRHHLTFFEMLGSWSIGNYFKQRAIELAIDLLTNGFGFASERLYITVFGGDSSLGLAPDEESARLWEAAGIPRERIVALGMADNFWGPAGETGPCGPCTEVFYDFGPAYGEAYRPGGVFDTTGRYIEIWNAGVFMQFDKGRDGTFDPLPLFSVDTGAGIERLTMALNEVATVFDIDVLSPLVVLAQELLGEKDEVADHHRLLADHMRAATFILSEGVRPSNEGRGYIPRRLIRKAVAVARLHGAGPDFDLGELAVRVIELMGGHYEQLGRHKDQILEMLAEEEREFSRAVQRGLDRLQLLLSSNDGAISGKDAFNLFATYGLPVEITRDLAAEQGVAVDEAAFDAEFKLHQETSRVRNKPGPKQLSSTDPLPDLPLPDDQQFVGYRTLSAPAKVVAIFDEGRRVPHASAGQRVELLLDATPFYAEGGGQVGDRGTFVADGDLVATVSTTTKHASGYHVHDAHVDTGTLREGQVVLAQVDEAKRLRTAANHSATHLLNAALRRVLGAHVRQAGSLVEPGRLRFDFTSPGRVALDQLLEVERIVNEAVLANLPRTVDVLPPASARETGAIFLDDEDYGDSIRVVRFGNASIEFCGGTHVDSTSQIGLFRITNEEAIAAGVRRINAVTREDAIALTLERDRLLLSTAARLKVNPSTLPERIEQLASRGKSQTTKPTGANAPLDLKVDHTTATPSAAAMVTDDADLRERSRQEADRLGAVVALAAAAGGKARVAVAVPKELASRIDARAVLRDLLDPINGSGGGSPQLAQGGGRANDGDLAGLIQRLPTAIRSATASAAS